MRSPRTYGSNGGKLLDQAVLDREADQLGAVFDAECLHLPVLVIFDGARRAVKRQGEPLGLLAFGR